MSLTSIQAKRTAAKTAVSELTELARGVHTAQQRSDKIEQCKTLLVDQAIDVLGTRRVDTTSTTDVFFEGDIEMICGTLGDYHTALGGTFMRELFCDPKPMVNYPPDCINPPLIKPVFPSGPMVLTYPAGEDIAVWWYQFQGTVEFQDNTIIEYNTPTDVSYINLPDDGDGYCRVMLRGNVVSFNQYNRAASETPGFGMDYVNKDLVSVNQWGTDLIVQSWDKFAFQCKSRCVSFLATDTPLFGVQPNGDVYGTAIRSFFNRTSWFDSDISHWDVSQVTDMRNFLYEVEKYSWDLSGWDVGNVTEYSGFAGKVNINPAHIPNFI